VAADGQRGSKDQPTLCACCSASKTVKETRRKLHAHRVMSLPVADKAGGYL
jgi:CBS-domain-containing membrane protein